MRKKEMYWWMKSYLVDPLHLSPLVLLCIQLNTLNCGAQFFVCFSLKYNIFEDRVYYFNIKHSTYGLKDLLCFGVNALDNIAFVMIWKRIAIKVSLN